MIVNHLSSVSKYKLSIELNGKPVEAVVDTGADVTIISEELFNSMKRKPKVKKRVTLNATGKKMKMNGSVVGPVRMKIV
ncbi:hypothetical protein DPMN_124069 [Dreissena polymorpha]|uniref:Peptidase A2 domain-containing protein n=1 Tax=Dreissena polymorpha TaxID=45954 RepID=A0A9D4GSJ4_DREPO|nr:hypothetical protein DPMN_124069 [Dreissena polymorpha]